MNNQPISENLIPPYENILSQREVAILQLTADGKCAKEIGAAVFISPRTVERYRDDIRHKLGASSLPHAVKIGLRRGLIN